MSKVVIVVLMVMSIVAPVFSGGAGEGQSKEPGPASESAPEGPAKPAFLEYWQEVDISGAWQVEEKEDGHYLIDGEGTALPLKEYGTIVVTSAGAVEILYGLQAQEHIAAIGTSRSGIWPEEETSKLPSVGGLSKPSFEKIISFEPELVIGNGMNTEVVAELNKLGIPAIIHSTDTIAEIMNAVLVLGVLSGTEKEAIETVVDRLRLLEELREQLAEKPLDLKGAFVYSVDPVKAFGEDSLPGEILSVLGVHNIAAGLATARPILSPEYIVEQDPDFLLGAMSIRNPEQILNADAMIKNTRAGRENNIIIVPSQMILRPTPRVIDTLNMLREKLVELVK